MLQLYDVNHNKISGLKNYKDYNIQREINQLDILSFLYPISDKDHNLILHEGYIRTKDNEYVVKEINYSDENYDQYICKVNIEGIQGTPVSHFETVEQKCSDSATLALAGTGWTVGNCDVTKLRTVRKNNCTSYDVLQEIQTTYGCEMTFDAINKKVNVYQVQGSGKGVYFTDQLNLKKVDKQSNSYDYITKLIPVGKDSLDITSVNGGKNYVENYQYSSKVITAYWEDNRYTVAEDLLEDAIERLAYLSIPLKAYSADIYDLANISDAYKNILDYSLGDTITLLSKERNVKEKQRIVKLVSYPDEPERNSCEIANKIASLDALNVRFQDTSDAVDSVTTSDGYIDGNKVDNIDWDKIQHVHIQTADIEDASITTAKIGTAQITRALIADAAIGTAQIDNAAITTAQIQNAAITNAKIGTAAILTANIADAQITGAKIQSATITTANIVLGAITTALIADGNITNAKIGNAAIGTAQIQDTAITTALIGDAQVVNAKIANATITGAKIANATIGSANIANAAIGTAQIATGAITTALIGTSAVGTTQIADGSITDAKIVGLTANKITAGTIDASVITVTNLNAANITVGTINGQQIASGAIGSSQLATDVNNTLNSAYSTANTALTNAATVQTNLNNLQIGGRNLLLNSAITNNLVNWGSSNSSTIAKVTTSPESSNFPIGVTSCICNTLTTANGITYQALTLLPNTTYTVSFWIYVPSSITGIANIATWYQNGGWNSIKSLIITERSQWVRKSLTFTTNATYTSTIIGFGLGGVTVGNVSYCALGKLEIGNKATDWTPAVEDVQGQISTAQTTADGKNTVYYQTSQPSGGTYTKGDVWFDTDDGYKMYVYNGTAWTASQFGTDAIANLSITNALIADGTILNAKISTLDAGKITTGTLAAARIAAGTITGTMIASTTITANNIASATITGAKIAANTITATQIASNTITAGQIASNTITATQIASRTITADRIVAGAITASEIASKTITSNQIASNTITSAEIAAGTITASNITAGTITSSQISANSITGDRIASNTITTDKLVIGDSTNLAGVNEITGANVNCYWTATSTHDGYIWNANNGYWMFLNNLCPIPCNPGELIYFEFYAVADTGFNSNLVAYTFPNPATGGANLGSAGFYITTTETKFSGYVTFPSYSNEIYFSMGLSNCEGKNVRLRKVFYRRAINTTMIADGAITTNKILAGSITSDRIQANSITADRLAAGTITVNSACIGSLNASWITSGTINAININGSVITGATINGSVITSTSDTSKLVINGGSISTSYNNVQAIHTHDKTMDFYDWDSAGTLIGSVQESQWINTNTKGIDMSVNNGKYISLAYGSDPNNLTWAYIMNNGLNPNGWTDRHIFSGGMFALNYLQVGDSSTVSSPNQSNWQTNSTLRLNGGACGTGGYSTIAFHQPGVRVDFIRTGNGNIELGYNGGWGSAGTIISNKLYCNSNDSNPALVMGQQINMQNWNIENANQIICRSGETRLKYEDANASQGFFANSSSVGIYDWKSNVCAIAYDRATRRLWINSNGSYGTTPSCTITIGDSDTGINWQGDGSLGFVSNGSTLFSISNANTVNFQGNQPTYGSNYMLYSSNIHFFEYVPNGGNQYGGFTATTGAYGFSIWNSDISLKANIQDSPITALDKINSINHRMFNWKDNGKLQMLGYVSQEIQQVEDSWVLKIPQPDGSIRMQPNETTIIPYLSKAIQEEDEKVESLKARIVALENEITQLKAAS